MTPFGHAWGGWILLLSRPMGDHPPALTTRHWGVGISVAEVVPKPRSGLSHHRESRAPPSQSDLVAIRDQHRRIHAERDRKPHDRPDRHIAPPRFAAAHVRAVELSEMGELLL